MVRQAVERMYKGSCTVYEYRKVKNEDLSTSYEEVEIHKNLPCHLAFKSLAGTNADSSVLELKQSSKLFISPDVKIKEGSKLVIVQNGKTYTYKNSASPSIYESHQEILLERFDRWA